MQRVLDHAYTSIAQELGALLAPVGPAWQRALHENAQLHLHQPDGSHPTPLGTYVAACVFYSAIYRKPLEQSSDSINIMSSSEARLAHTAAWEAVKSRK